MIQIIGIIEVSIFYFAYFFKLFMQKKKGISTNQLGKGTKSRKTIVIETMLRISSMVIVFATLISAICNTSIISIYYFRYLGLVLLGVGTCIFIIAMMTMRDSWRAGIPKEDKTKLVNTGIYKYSRNPAFVGFDLTYIGASLAYSNIALVMISIITIVLMHLQILEEEKFLESAFGLEYVNYKSKVSRYF